MYKSRRVMRMLETHMYNPSWIHKEKGVPWDMRDDGYFDTNTGLPTSAHVSTMQAKEPARLGRPHEDGHRRHREFTYKCCEEAAQATARTIPSNTSIGASPQKATQHTQNTTTKMQRQRWIKPQII